MTLKRYSPLPTRALMKPLSLAVLVSFLTLHAHAAPPFAAPDFDCLHALVQPQPGEAKWATIPWLTDLATARARAARDDKPLFVWRAGGGEVLGRA
jgi:hypothetical protein